MGSLTVRVEKSTSDLLIGPDWTMNMDICDSINSDHWQAKDAVKAVKKRLQNKNPKVQLLALTLLETMIKNCGDYVHFQVVEKNTLQVMIKIIRKKTDMAVRDKILVLLDSWQQAFGGPGGKYPQYFWAYDELRRSGVEFPQRSEDAAPIFTPPITHPSARHPQAGYGMPSNTSRRLDEAMASEMEGLSLSSLNSIRSIMELLTDMLDALNPNDHGAIKDEVIVELVDRCRYNQKKLIQLLNSTVDEELLGQGLSLNDNLQNLLAKHDAIASGSPLPTELATPRHKTNASASTPSTASNRVEEEEEEDDDFAQLARRCSKTKSVLSETTSMETNDLALSLNCADVTAPSTAQATASTSILIGPLTLPEPPNPVKTAPKEQDMIDLLSSTLSISSPHTPPAAPSVFNQTGNHIPVSPNKQGYPYVTQPSPLNQGQVTYHSYVVPWAQPQPPPHSQPQPRVPPRSQLQPQQHLLEPLSRNHPQPQVQAHPHTRLQNQVQPQAQAPTYPQPQVHPHSQSQFQAHPHPQLQYELQPQSQAQPQPQPKPSQLPSSYPPPPWEFATNSDPGSSLSATAHAFSLSHPNTAPVQAVGPWQRYHSFGSRGNNAASEPNANPGSRQAVAVKPFVHPNRLFEDLIDLKNTDGELKTGGRSSSLMRTGSADGGMMSGRK